MNHLKNFHTHLKHHHKKYLFGMFGSFAVVKAIFLFAGLFGLINMIEHTFAIVTVTDTTITGTSLVGQTLTGSYIYKDLTRRPVGMTGFSSGQIHYPSLALDGTGTPYLAYMDYAYDNKATVMKFNGTGWETVGTSGFSSGGVVFVSLALDGTGTPYVAYQDSGNSQKATVMKYNGTNRESVGVPGFSVDQAEYTSLFLYDGTPYVAFRDQANDQKATVMKFNGTGWETVGISGFSDREATDISIYIYDGIIYVAYSDRYDVGQATVMKFAGTGWEVVGTPRFSDGNITNSSLFVYSGVPYVAYVDYSDIGQATVMKFNGTSREAVGTPRFSSGTVGIPSLYVYSGVPYIAYSDGSYIGQATVMKFNGTGWEAVGTPSFSDGSIGYDSLYVYSGVPYVAYSDNFDNGQATVMKFDPESEGTSRYQWYRNNVMITGATGLTYTLTPADAGRTLKFEVIPASLGGIVGTSAFATMDIPAPSASAVTITGTFSVNEILTGLYTYTDTTSGGLDPEGTSRYQRYRNDVAITGATGLSYMLARADAGVTIKFEVTPVSIAGALGTPIQSNGVLINHFPTATNVMITGTPNTGEILTGSYTYSDSDVNRGAVGIPRFSENQADNTSLYVYSGVPYIAYVDYANSSKATVMKFNGTSWEAVGISGFSVGQAAYVSLFVDNEIPYVIYEDYANDYKATVMKFNGTGWEAVGTSGFSIGEVYYTSLFVDSGILYSSFADYSGGAWRATVMKFNGSSWETIGTPIPSEGGENILFVSNGIPYIGYSDPANDYKATVMKFNGSDWEAVGMSGFSSGGISYPSLFVASGILYMAYSDSNYSRQTTVMKFNGSSWETVGTPGFSNGETYYTSLYVYNGIPYVAYSDEGNNYKATVMKFNGATWEAVGAPSFSDGQANEDSLFVYSGIVYIAYSDYSDIGQTTVMKAVASDFEGTSSYQWYRNDIAILGATGLTYTLAAGDAGTTIKFEVTPVALSGSSPGIAVQSTGLLINGGQGGGGDIGGGGGGILPKDVCTPDRDCSSSYYDHLCGPCSSTGEAHTSAVSCTAYSDELNGAYIFAYDNGITTIKNCIGADLQGNLIRSHMAKMVSQFAIKVLKMKPDTKKTSCTFPDMNNESKEMQFYATIACQLGLMGLDTDGVTPKATFDPNNTVDRAQFGTILSRILRGTKYAGDLPFYVKHLNALKKEAIMNDITRPLAPEMRGRVMLMLQRSAGEK